MNIASLEYLMRQLKDALPGCAVWIKCEVSFIPSAIEGCEASEETKFHVHVLDERDEFLHNEIFTSATDLVRFVGKLVGKSHVDVLKEKAQKLVYQPKNRIKDL